MIGWALCFEPNFCIILYDTSFSFFRKKRGAGGEEGVSQIYAAWYDVLD